MEASTKGNIREILAETLTMKIRQSGKSQAELAQEVGVSTSTLSAYCTGARYPRPELLEKLADALHTSVGSLTGSVSVRLPRDEVSREAELIALSFDQLDEHGRNLIRMIVDAELKRVRGKT